MSVTVATGRCPLCGLHSSLDVTEEQARRIRQWRANPSVLIQTALADLSAGQREQIINGSHEACFDAAFPDEE